MCSRSLADRPASAAFTAANAALTAASRFSSGMWTSNSARPSRLARTASAKAPRAEAASARMPSTAARSRSVAAWASALSINDSLRPCSPLRYAHSAASRWSSNHSGMRGARRFGRERVHAMHEIREGRAMRRRRLRPAARQQVQLGELHPLRLGHARWTPVELIDDLEDAALDGLLRQREQSAPDPQMPALPRAVVEQRIGCLLNAIVCEAVKRGGELGCLHPAPRRASVRPPARGSLPAARPTALVRRLRLDSRSRPPVRAGRSACRCMPRLRASAGSPRATAASRRPADRRRSR